MIPIRFKSEQKSIDRSVHTEPNFYTYIFGYTKALILSAWVRSG